MHGRINKTVITSRDFLRTSVLLSRCNRHGQFQNTHYYEYSIGLAYGTGAYFGFDMPLPHCFVAAGLCSVAGMLPDLDSDSGIPLREMLSFVSVIVPLLMLNRFEQLGMSAEQMVFVAGVLYVVHSLRDWRHL